MSGWVSSWGGGDGTLLITQVLSPTCPGRGRGRSVCGARVDRRLVSVPFCLLCRACVVLSIFSSNLDILSALEVL